MIFCPPPFDFCSYMGNYYLKARFGLLEGQLHLCMPGRKVFPRGGRKDTKSKYSVSQCLSSWMEIDALLNLKGA